jgi:phage terminase large subunit-like protein
VDRFERFIGILTLPTGDRFVLEPFQRLIVREALATGRVELLVLLPKGNGKTTLFAALAVWHLLTTPNAECFIGAADKEQADELYRFASHFIDAHDDLSQRFKVLPATRTIRSKHDQGFARVLASDNSKAGGKRHSFNPTLALIDELHAHENDNLYAALRSAAFKRQGLVVTISTAGHDQESTLGKLRAAMHAQQDHRSGLVVNGEGNPEQGDGRLTIARSSSHRTVMLEWACRDEYNPLGKDDLDDLDVVNLANPASFVTRGSLEDAREAPGITPWAFARYRANVWTVAFESWIPDGAWADLPHAEIPDDAEGVVLAVDMARYRDCAAIAAVWPNGGRYVVCAPYIKKSGGHAAPIEYAEIKDTLRELCKRWDVRAIGFDPKYFDQAAEELAYERLPMTQFDQSNERMGPASADLREAIIALTIDHDHDPQLARHVAAGVTKDVGENVWRLIKSKNAGPPIDALIALTMAFRLALVLPPRGPLFEVLS